MCNCCRPFNGKTLGGIKGAITATLSFANDSDPMFKLEVSHWEPVDQKTAHIRKVTSVQELPINFCPICGRNLRGDAK